MLFENPAANPTELSKIPAESKVWIPNRIPIESQQIPATDSQQNPNGIPTEFQQYSAMLNVICSKCYSDRLFAATAI